MASDGSIDAYDNVAGNAYDKYHSTNPIARRLMDGFLNAFDRLSARSGAQTAFEIGCGEGELSVRLMERGLVVSGFDLEAEVVAQANALAAGRGHGRPFTARSVYDLQPGEVSADLLVCCEVLEHLPDPARALDIIAAQRTPHVLLSVPREPIWRALNLARGKYIKDLGNTPGHLQHWSQARFLGLVRSRLDVIEMAAPLPWTMVLCRRSGG